MADNINRPAQYVSLIDGHIDEPKKQTNYDRIRNMSVEEMSNFLMDWAIKMFEGTMPMNVKTWLESEVSE